MKTLFLTFFLTFALSTALPAENQQPRSSDQSREATAEPGAAKSEEISVKELPEAVQRRIEYQARYLQLDRVTRQMQGNEPVYEATFSKEKTTTILQLREDGSTAGMRVVSSAPIVMERAGAQRPNPQNSQTTTATATPAQGRTQPSYPVAPETAAQAAPAEEATTTGGGVTGQLPPTPGSPGVPGGGLTGQLPVTESAGSPTPTASQAQNAQGQQSRSSVLPSKIQSAVQQQIGSMQIQSAKSHTFYEVDVLDANGQSQKLWVDSSGKLLQSMQGR